MSRIRQIIELETPTMIDEARPERFMVNGFMCPECLGDGRCWKADGKDFVEAPCRVCGGTGEVDAEVTVSWKRQKGGAA